MQEGDSKNWREVLAANPEARAGDHNSERIQLLKPGIYFEVGLKTAESWILALKEIRETAEELARAQGKTMPPAQDPVRITIVDIPENGSVEVEVAGKRYTIASGVLAHCIKDPTPTPVVMSRSFVQGLCPDPSGNTDGSGWSHN